MNLVLSIMYMYPEIKYHDDFLVWNDFDGKGDYIKEWSLQDKDGKPIPRPTQAELEMAWESYLRKEEAKPPVQAPEERMNEMQANFDKAIVELTTLIAMQQGV